MKKLWWVPLCLGLVCAAGPSFAQDAVVKIYIKRADRSASQGTGFFSTNGGQVVTAYHVVEGATSIEVVHHRLGTFAQVQVDSIAPAYDLAILQILHAVAETPFLEFAELAPDVTDQLQMMGHPRGGVLQQFQGHATRSGFVNSHTIRDSRGRRLFETEIDIVPLDLTIYLGMSGGPVIGPGGVIGILSGSYDEGGGLAWAIPSKYLHERKKVGKMPAAIKWDKMTLMASPWRHLRTSVRLNVAAAQFYDRYVEEVETLARISDELNKRATAAHGTFLIFRPFLRTVISDPTLSKDWETASQLLDLPKKQFRRSFVQFRDILNEKYANSQRLNVAFTNLCAWIEDESGIPDQEQEWRALLIQMQEILDQHPELREGLESHLGIKIEDMAVPVVKFYQGIERAEGGSPGEQAQVILDFIDAYQPVLEKYNSTDALRYMTWAVSKFRRLALLFEPIVYERR